MNFHLHCIVISLNSGFQLYTSDAIIDPLAPNYNVMNCIIQASTAQTEIANIPVNGSLNVLTVKENPHSDIVIVDYVHPNNTNTPYIDINKLKKLKNRKFISEYTTQEIIRDANRYNTIFSRCLWI